MRLNGTFCSSKNLPWDFSLAASNSRSNTICTATPRFLVCGHPPEHFTVGEVHNPDRRFFCPLLNSTKNIRRTPSLRAKTRFHRHLRTTSAGEPQEETATDRKFASPLILHIQSCFG